MVKVATPKAPPLAAQAVVPQQLNPVLNIFGLQGGQPGQPLIQSGPAQDPSIMDPQYRTPGQNAFYAALGQGQGALATAQKSLNDQAAFNAAQLGGQQYWYGQNVDALKRQEGLKTQQLQFMMQKDEITRGAYARQLAEAGQLDKLTLQSLNLSEAEAKRAAKRQKKAEEGAAAAGGAIGSAGHRDALLQIQQDLADTRQRINMARQREGIAYKEEVASIRDANKMLDVHAKLLGLELKDFKLQIDEKLAQLGYSNFMNAESLGQALLDKHEQVAQIAQGVYSNAIAAKTQADLANPGATGGAPFSQYGNAPQAQQQQGPGGIDMNKVGATIGGWL